MVRAEQFERQGSSNLPDGGFRQYAIEEADLAEDQNRVTRPRREKRSAIRTSASRQTETGSVFAVRTTQLFQRELSPPAQPLHLDGQARHEKQSLAEEHRPIEIDDSQRISLVEAILLAKSGRKR